MIFTIVAGLLMALNVSAQTKTELLSWQMEYCLHYGYTKWRRTEMTFVFERKKMERLTRCSAGLNREGNNKSYFN